VKVLGTILLLIGMIYIGGNALGYAFETPLIVTVVR